MGFLTRCHAALAASVLTPCLALASAANAPTPAAPACPQGQQNALSELGCELRSQLGAELGAGTWVAIGPVHTDRPLERADALAERVVRVVGGSLGPGLRIHGAPVERSEALALGARGGRVVYLEARLEGGSLRITADLHQQARAFWDRVLSPNSAPTRHAFAQRIADGELRSFFPTPPLVAAQRDHVPLPDRSALTVACGDVGADGALEVVLVGRHRVSVGRLRAGAFAASAERAWSELSPVAAAPLRAPLAAARIHRGELLLGSSDRAHLVRWTAASAAPVGPRALPLDTGGCAALEPTALSLGHTACLGDSSAFEGLVEGPLDAVAVARVVNRAGASRHIVAARAAGADAAQLLDDAGRRASVANVGAQLALADLDGDGQVELLSSRPTFVEAEDTLRVDTWRDDGSVQPRYELPLSAIRAIAACPWSGAGPNPIVVAAGGDLWVLR